MGITFAFGTGKVIKGWDYGLKGMRKGGERTLTIPPSLAYGNNNDQPSAGPGKVGIPAGSTLKFECNLTEVRTLKQLMKALHVKDTKVGTGQVIQNHHQVVMSYVGKLASGKVFDQNKHFSFMFGAGQVIPGWDYGLTGMRVGGKRTLVIPPEFGYGDEAAGPIP